MEEVRIDARNYLHLSPTILAALDCRAGDVVVVKYGAKCVEVRKKEKE